MAVIGEKEGSGNSVLWVASQDDHNLPVSHGAQRAARGPVTALTKMDTIVPDTVATNQIGAALETVDLLDKVIERGNFAGKLSPPAVITDL